MTTALETITSGLEALRVIGMGQQPTQAQSTYCLKHLNAFIAELAGFGGSIAFISETVEGSFNVGTTYPAIRLLCLNGATVTLPQADSSIVPPPDGMRVHVIDAAETADTSNITIARNGWLINGAASNYTISTEGGSAMLMFRADQGDWKLVSSLALADTVPFPSDFDMPIALNAALRYTRFGQRLSEEDQRLARRGMNRIRARYAKAPTAVFDLAASGIAGNRFGAGGRSYNDFLQGIE
jgi:hypothetical protein